MLSISPDTALHHLISSKQLPLSELPAANGVNALHDHLGQIRYVGVTGEKDRGFRGRITNRHVTGSEDRSHKFSQAYNCGRMWRLRAGHTLQNSGDARAAKRLRTSFIRRHCRATYLAIENPGLDARVFLTDLTAIEALIQAAAPPLMRSWEGKRFASLNEPAELVDSLLLELNWSRQQIDAVNRQAALFARLAG